MIVPPFGINMESTVQSTTPIQYGINTVHTVPSTTHKVIGTSIPQMAQLLLIKMEIFMAISQEISITTKLKLNG